jgi:hypothetical protein
VNDAPSAPSADAPVLHVPSGGSPGAKGGLIAAAGWLYPATTALSAALLFTLQPLFAKMLTPLMGGTPAVWNTALVFYQGALLLGYLYAHVIATRLKPRAQLLVHAAVLLIGAIFLPIKVTTLAGPPDVGAPVMWTLAARPSSPSPPPRR